MSRRQHRHRDTAGGGPAQGRESGRTEPGAAGGGARPGAPRRDRRSSRWDDHRRARRRELTLATVAAIRVHGADVGMSQVAAQARTSKTVVYRHFADKFDLYLAVCEQVATVIVAKLQKAMREAADPELTVHAGVDAYLALIEADPEVYRYVMRPPRLDRAPAEGTDPVADMTTLVGNHVGDVIATVLRRRGHDAAPAVTWGHAMVGMVRSAADQWLAHRPDVPREELAAQLAELAWSGLSRSVGHPVVSGAPPASSASSASSA